MSNFTESIANVNGAINSVVWGFPVIILILATGLWLTFGSGLVQFTHFGYAMKNTLGKLFKGDRQKAAEGSITPFQAVTTALASTVGTGNIAGVAGAITLGGPGAVFWMWISALVGMATKYAEVVLAIRYRERNPRGEWAGGAMYYIRNGMGKNWKWLAMLFAFLGMLAAFGIGNMTQVNSVSGTVVSAFKALSSNPDGLNIFLIRLLTGLFVAIFVGIVLLGGIKRIGATTEIMVPFMAVFYILGSLGIIIINIGSIGPVMKEIFTGAFGGFEPMVGGVAGFAIKETIKRGFSRGIFSNEAGLGSAPMAHATADTKGPVQQGVYGILEVFLDTIIICSMSALIVLMSGIDVPYGSPAGAELTTAALATIFGSKFAALFMAIALGCFALSTVLGWSLYGTRCCEYLLGPKSVRPYQIIFILCTIVGATMELGLAWDIADTLNGLMAIPNLIALLVLSGVVFKLTKDHFAQVKAGEIE